MAKQGGGSRHRRVSYLVHVLVRVDSGLVAGPDGDDKVFAIQVGCHVESRVYAAGSTIADIEPALRGIHGSAP